MNRRTVTILICLVLTTATGWWLYEKSRLRSRQEILAEKIALMEKLDAVVLKEFELENATLDEAVAALNEHASRLSTGTKILHVRLWKEGDPIPQGLERNPAPKDMKTGIDGLESVPKTEGADSDKPDDHITQSLTNLTVIEAAAYLATLSGLQLEYSGRTVWIYPATLRTKRISETRFLATPLRLPPALDQTLLENDVINVKPWMASDYGLQFDPDDVFNYEPKDMKVVIRMSADSFDVFERGISGYPSKWERSIAPIRDYFQQLWYSIIY